MIRASHSLDTPLGDVKDMVARPLQSSGMQRHGHGPSACQRAALELPFWTFIDLRGDRGDRIPQQFSARPTFPCKIQAAMGSIFVVLRDLLGVPAVNLTPRESAVGRQSGEVK